MSAAGAAFATAGLDLGGTKCLGVVVDVEGRLLAEVRRPTPVGSDAILGVLAEVVEALTATASVPSPVAVGVGLPGLVDRDGVLRAAPNLPGVVGLPVAQRLADALRLPVVAENDATAATWAECVAGAGRGRSHLVMVTFGTGIGGGLVADGRLVRGVSGFAGEIGHMVVVPDGHPCGCGLAGCWEQYASGNALGRTAREQAAAGRLAGVVARAGGDAAAVRGEHVVAAALAGDGEARALLAELARWVAGGLANLANLLDPEAFVLGGGLAGAADLLLDAVRAELAEALYAAHQRPVPAVVAAELGERAGAIGAALLARAAVPG